VQVFTRAYLEKYFFRVQQRIPAFMNDVARAQRRFAFAQYDVLTTGSLEGNPRSAFGCAAAWMVQHGIAPSDQRVLIEQGVEAKHPSRIFVRASRRNDRVVNVRVGGNVVEVLRGELFF
jgi:hypothetical protein